MTFPEVETPFVDSEDEDKEIVLKPEKANFEKEGIVTTLPIEEVVNKIE